MSNKANLDNSAQKSKVSSTSLFTKQNYKLIIAGILTLSIGYLLMIGGKSPNPNTFNNDALYGFQRITLAPIIIVIGFAIVFYGILKNPKQE